MPTKNWCRLITNLMNPCEVLQFEKILIFENFVWYLCTKLCFDNDFFILFQVINKWAAFRTAVTSGRHKSPRILWRWWHVQSLWAWGYIWTRWFCWRHHSYWLQISVSITYFGILLLIPHWLTGNIISHCWRHHSYWLQISVSLTLEYFYWCHAAWLTGDIISHIDSLLQKRHNSSVNALELHFCIKPLIWSLTLLCVNIFEQTYMFICILYHCSSLKHCMLMRFNVKPLI